ncbi:tyrosyl-DNA phosphodiesterase 2-like isoform X2 [Dreissena polymorpha]|uniref:tyrosyl-DNA phosphodiesterase 2-like isoform X2 n=1 Tax=Dreissena polymorpha TaxID=45954 RepID=UPI0022656020|nr:tyrosyl-DNA phosphodiesterase 2-like isoform X2 [Dreissena polymorpha]
MRQNMSGIRFYYWHRHGARHVLSPRQGMEFGCEYRALNSYFEESAAGGVNTASASALQTTTVIQTKKNKENKPNSSNKIPEQAGSGLPFRIRVLSWNIDGLDKDSLRSRTQAVCETIKREDPHVVFLQEVVVETQEIIQELCPLYHMIPGNEEAYFAAILVKIGDVQVEETKILPFPNTVMLRNLISLKCIVKGEKFVMMTSHLESTKEYSKERQEQLKQCFKYIGARDKGYTVIFGGDLNLRDNEIDAIGGLPENIYDIWEITGKRPEAKFTWDLMRNDNLRMPNRFKPRCRFDRLYIRHSEQKEVKAEYFELCGLERLRNVQRFCSDHWGLLAHFNILSKIPK